MARCRRALSFCCSPVSSQGGGSAAGLLLASALLITVRLGASSYGVAGYFVAASTTQRWSWEPVESAALTTDPKRRCKLVVAIFGHGDGIVVLDEHIVCSSSFSTTGGSSMASTCRGATVLPQVVQSRARMAVSGNLSSSAVNLDPIAFLRHLLGCSVQMCWTML
jgi:hypothetical protein